MTTNTKAVEFDLVEIGTLAKTLIGAGLPETLIHSNVKALYKGFDVKRISDAVAAYEAKIARDDQMAKVARLSYDDKMKLAKSDAEYKTLLDAAIKHLVEFRKARATLFAYAKETYSLELKWQTESETPSPMRAQRVEGSNANGGLEKGGLTYANGTYEGIVNDQTFTMIVNHNAPEDATYSTVTLVANGVTFGIPSPRVASDYVNGLHADSVGQLSAKEFWTFQNDNTAIGTLSPLPTEYLDWAKVDTRKVVKAHTERYKVA